ncbi:unnamed protein product [Moneuplotes crassus]|uniref:PH domain-containing protein n=1 Tax=Euplotes crassus TaxID=5936 RepID=A0AAD1XZQ7_EUPCR|nr:unnamed protein product [Moneuplotes crassus]
MDEFSSHKFREKGVKVKKPIMVLNDSSLDISDQNNTPNNLLNMRMAGSAGGVYLKKFTEKQNSKKNRDLIQDDHAHPRVKLNNQSVDKKIIKVPSSALESSEWSNLNDSLPVRLGGNFKLDNFTRNMEMPILCRLRIIMELTEISYLEQCILLKLTMRKAQIVISFFQLIKISKEFHRLGFITYRHIVDSSIDEGSQAQRLQNNFESLIPQAIKGKNEYINHADNRRVSQEIHETERDLLHMMNPRNSIIHRDAVDEEEDKKENKQAPNLHNYENDRYISEDEEEVDGRFNNPETSFVTVKGNKLMSLVNKIHGLVTPNKHQKTQRNLRSSCMANKIERLNSPHASEVANYTRSFYLVQGEYPTENIILTQKAGNIEVKLPTGVRWLRKFRRRYCVIKDHCIFIYKKREKKLTEFVIDLNSLTAAIFVQESEPLRAFKLKILGLAETVDFRIPSDQAHTNEAQDWVQTLFEHLESSKGYYTDLASVPLSKSLVFSYPRLENSEFIKMADTGDILLFRGFSKASKFQRMMTCSKYDHVAMVLKGSDDKVLLFESTSTLGVTFIDWQAFHQIGWPKKYQRVVYRKLKHERNNEDINRLESFLVSVKDKKFKFSIKSVLGKNNYNNEQEQTFFCSELVAASYQTLGILPEDTVCSRYWPGSFSTEKSIPLINGATLGEEYLIV